MRTPIVVLCLLMGTAALYAQPRPAPLPSLGWKPGATYVPPHTNTAYTAAREAVVDFAEADFSFGWNWAAPRSKLGERFRGRRWHVSDYFDAFHNGPTHPDDMQAIFDSTYFPGIQLVSVVRGVTDARPGMTIETNPSEAPAVEFAPWLNFNSATNDVDLEPTDATGSVFGFADRFRGTRTGDGSTTPYGLTLVRDQIEVLTRTSPPSTRSSFA
ncbi:MAG: hypothetical protein NTX15_10230 [Candidatus Kapabacteria bacterium]|nr:hypothetical protein [Candidatus Kapabacteria bacterium]